ncbi:MAG: DUF4376 domain-containing protein, partial [Roseateles sp.]
IAQLEGEPYEQPWVLEDNTVVLLDAPQQIAVARACKRHVAELWAASEVLRAQIYAATDIAAVRAVVWPPSTSGVTP